MSCRDHNSRGCAAVNADQLGCEGNRLSRWPDRDEGPWIAGGVTAGETASIGFSHECAVFWSIYSILGALVLVVTFVFSLDLFSIP